MPILEFDLEHVYPDDVTGGILLSVKLEAGEQSTRLTAYLDTGCSHCLFQGSYAELLGMELTRGMPLSLTTGDGGIINAYGHEVTIEVLDQRVESVVYFTDHPGFRRNVLGRQGWLHHFKLGLVHYESKIYLGSLTSRKQ